MQINSNNMAKRGKTWINWRVKIHRLPNFNMLFQHARELGPAVWTQVSASPGLNLNLAFSFFLFLSNALSRISFFLKKE